MQLDRGRGCRGSAGPISARGAGRSRPFLHGAWRCIPKPRAYSIWRWPTAKPGAEDPVRPDRACGGQHPDGPAGAGTEGSRQVPRSGPTTTRNSGRRWPSARQGKWADAREKFKSVEFAITSLPIDLQRIVIADAMHASIEVKDYPGAAKRSSELDVIGIAPEQAPAVAVLRGRLAEASVTTWMRWTNTSAPSHRPIARRQRRRSCCRSR